MRSVSPTKFPMATRGGGRIRDGDGKLKPLKIDRKSKAGSEYYSKRSRLRVRSGPQHVVGMALC